MIKNPPLAGFLLLASCGDIVAARADGDHRQEQDRREQDQNNPSGNFDHRHYQFRDVPPPNQATVRSRA